MSDKYRKCVKCGISSVKDPTLRFHSFPRAGRAFNYQRVRLWAEFCFGNKTFTDEELKGLYKSHKLLCSKHFDRSAFTNDTMTKLNPTAIPSQPKVKTPQQPVVSEFEQVLLQIPIEDSPTSALPESSNQPAKVLFLQIPLEDRPTSALPASSHQPVKVGEDIASSEKPLLLLHKDVCSTAEAETSLCRNSSPLSMPSRSSSPETNKKITRNMDIMKKLTDKYFAFEKERERMAHHRELVRMKQCDKIIAVLDRFVNVIESLAPSIQRYMEHNSSDGR